MRTICLFSGDITRCGGTERIAILLANELAKQQDTTVCFLSLTESRMEPFFALDQRVKRHQLFRHAYPFRLILLPVILKLLLFLRKNHITHLIDVDVILSLASVFAVPFTNCRLISWEHFHFRENLGCKLRDYARKLAKRYASCLVVLTENDRMQYLEQRCHADVRVIPNAVSEPTQNSGNASVVLPDTPFLLSVGRLDFQKGLERIPALAESILRTHTDWKWVIVGDGSFRESIRADIATRGLSDKVLLMGRQDPYPYYRKAAFLVMPSRYEGFGLVLIEALSVGCPVIAFDCPHGPSDIIRQGINGWLVAAEDFPQLEKRILEMMESPDLLARFAQNAPSGIDAFSVPEFMKKWNDILPGERQKESI